MKAAENMCQNITCFSWCICGSLDGVSADVKGSISQACMSRKYVISSQGQQRGAGGVV